MKNIEVEVRSFVSKEKFEELLDFFKENAELIKEDYQETFYFDCEQDLRIQKNKFYSKVWLKKGKLHDDHREELEIKFKREDFENLKKIFLSLGYDVDIKWLRKRFQFKWDNVTVCLDNTKGYGYIIELEKICSNENKEKEYKIIEEKLKSLDVSITPKEEFDKKFKNYKQNWEKLIC